MPKEIAIESLTFETAIAELDKIVATLERGQVPLEEAISQYKRGVALKEHCEKKLNDAKLQIEKILHNSGKITATEELKMAD